MILLSGHLCLLYCEYSLLGQNGELEQDLILILLKLKVSPVVTRHASQGASPNSNLPPTLISSEFSSLLTEKLRMVAKLYKMVATDEIKGAVYALRPLRGKVENFFQFEEEVREIITSIF